MKHNHTWNEIFAALVLVESGELTAPFSNEWLKDRPDLQIGNTGIEVTESVRESSAAADRFANKLLSCDSYEDAMEMQNKNRKADEFRPFQILDTPDFGIDYRTSGWDENDVMYLIAQCINNKQEKWKNYIHVHIRQLYVKVTDDLLGMPTHPLNTKIVFDLVNRSIFDKIYLYLQHTLYAFSKGHLEPKITKFNQETKLKIAIESCRLADCPKDHMARYQRALSDLKKE